jgi:D-glycero-D-manno-heptose 1,7-bisphosphate phosphatase
VAQGYFPETALRAVEDRLRELLGVHAIAIDGFYYCPHHPQAAIERYRLECDCRKPAPGLVLRAAARHGIELARSWFIGDILNDIEAGHLAGCRTVLIDNGNETLWRFSPERLPDLFAADLSEAAAMILGDRTPPFDAYFTGESAVAALAPLGDSP